MLSKPRIVILCLLAIASGYGIAMLRGLPQTVQNATLLDRPRALPPFELLDHKGQPFTLEDMYGHWSVLFFGFSNCPDVCPTTLAVLRDAYTSIASRNPALLPRIYLVSVDPERDTAQKLAAYVPFFHPEFTGVTGSVAAINAFAQTMSVAHNQVPMADGTYTVDHSSAVFFIDPDGRYAALSSAPHLPQVLAHDYLVIAGR